MRVIALLLLSCAVALAQPAPQPAPPEPPHILPYYEPSQPPPPPLPPPPIMKRRWAIAASLGYERITPRSDARPQAPFTMVDVSGRFRLYPDLELAVSLQLGGGTAEDMTQLSSVGIVGEVRYRLFAREPWNGYLFGGLGVRSVAEKNADTTAAQPRGALRFGAGVERRFDRFAIAADAQYRIVAENSQVPDEPTPTTAHDFARYGLRGWYLGLAGIVYL